MKWLVNYKEYAKVDSSNVLNTKIFTKINSHLCISSIYRKYSNPNFELWGWETFVWNDDKIIRQYDVLDDAEDVVNLHSEIESTWYATGEVKE